MTRVGIVPRGAAFWPTVAEWLAENFQRDNLRILVPTARAASSLKALLERHAVTGATVLALRGDAAMAGVAGIEMPRMIPLWKLRGEVVKIVQELQPELSAGKLVAQAGELAEVMERLSAYEAKREGLRAALPEGLAVHWEENAQVLLAVMARLEKVLEREGLMLAGAASVKVFEALRAKGGGWVCAGVMDATPAARRMIAELVQGGGVVVPEGGVVTQTMITEWLAGLGISGGEKIAARVREAGVREIVCAGGWQEARAVALAVRRAVEQGRKRIAAVTPDGKFLARVNGELARWELRGRFGGGESVSESAAGNLWMCLLAVAGGGGAVERAALKAVVKGEIDWQAIWGLPRAGLMGEWVTRLTAVMEGLVPAWQELDGAGIVGETLALVKDQVGAVDAGMACALLERLLRETMRTSVGSEGVYLLSPQDARLQDFDTVITANMVEGCWPKSDFNMWLVPAQMKALGMPDNARRALLTRVEFESLLHGGSGEVIVTHTAVKDSGKVVSRYLNGVVRERDAEIEEWIGVTAGRKVEALGVFVPGGAQYPHVWSASFVEALLACPYKAYAERILKLRERDPIEPVPDARVGGLLVHAWLEIFGREVQTVTAENAEACRERLLVIAEEVLDEEDRVTQAIWRPKLKKLAWALVDKWVADGRTVEAVEKEVSREMGSVVVRAIVDRVERLGTDSVVLDYKTGSVPAWSAVASGERPQLALEAWLLGEVSRLEYWKLRGFGSAPLEVKDTAAAKMMEAVQEGVARLVGAFGEGAPFPALPDKKGGGLLATGHCEYCALNGVCRRQAEAGG